MLNFLHSEEWRLTLLRIFCGLSKKYKLLSLSVARFGLTCGHFCELYRLIVVDHVYQNTMRNNHWQSKQNQYRH